MALKENQLKGAQYLFYVTDVPVSMTCIQPLFYPCQVTHTAHVSHAFLMKLALSPPAHTHLLSYMHILIFIGNK